MIANLYDYWANKKGKPYNLLIKLSDIHKLSISKLIYILGIPKGHYDRIKIGTWEWEFSPDDKEILEYTLELRDEIEANKMKNVFAKSAFLFALRQFLECESIDRKRLKRQIIRFSDKLPPSHTKIGYMEALKEVYNYKHQDRITFEAIKPFVYKIIRYDVRS